MRTAANGDSLSTSVTRKAEAATRGPLGPHVTGTHLEPGPGLHLELGDSEDKGHTHVESSPEETVVT